MAKITNSPLPNQFGKGNEKIFTSDNGKSYTIKNSPLPNLYGEGNEQIVTENNSSPDLDLIGALIVAAILIPFGIAVFGLGFFISWLITIFG